MKSKPKIKIKTTKGDKLIESSAWLLLIVIWSMTFYDYLRLPDIIPTHYNDIGMADGFSKKSMIFNLPLIATFLFIVLTILNNFPHIFNYPTQITEDNALHQYTRATRTMRALKVIVLILLGYNYYVSLNGI